jgi:hypothetical protein
VTTSHSGKGTTSLLFTSTQPSTVSGNIG